MSMQASRKTEEMSVERLQRRYSAQGRASKELRVAGTVSKDGG